MDIDKSISINHKILKINLRDDIKKNVKNKNNNTSQKIFHKYLQKKKGKYDKFKIKYKNKKFFNFLKAHEKENLKKKNFQTHRKNLNENFIKILKSKNIRIKTEKSAKKFFKQIISKSPKIIKNLQNLEELKKEFSQEIFKSNFISKNFSTEKKILTTNFPNSNIISSRTDSASTLLKKNIIIIYGGKSYKIFSDLYVINIKKKKIDKIEIENKLSEIFNIKRYGHKIHYVNGFIYVLGGFAYNNSEKNIYKLSSYKFDNFFFKINLKDKKFVFENLNIFPNPRRNFSSVLLDNEFFVVFGGEDFKNKFLNELWIFSISENFWVKLNLSVNTFKFIFFGISNHSMCVVQGENKIDLILKLSEEILYERKKSIFTVDEEEVINLEIKKKQKKLCKFFTQRNSSMLNKKKSIFYSKKFFNTKYSINKNRNTSKKNNISANQKKNIFSIKKNFEKNFPLFPIPKLFSYKKKLKIIKNLNTNTSKKSPKSDNTRQLKKKIITQFKKSLKSNLIILFGGINSNFEKNPNNIRYLKFNKIKRKFYWKILYINSEKPNPIYSNSLNYIKEKNCLIIYGGKNDKEKFIKNFWILNLNNLKWVRKDIVGELNGGRSGHIGECVGNLFVVLGGTDSKGFVDGGLNFGVLNKGRRFF